jgi:biopolymer transport protein ExbD
MQMKHAGIFLLLAVFLISVPHAMAKQSSSFPAAPTVTQSSDNMTSCSSPALVVYVNSDDGTTYSYTLQPTVTQSSDNMTSSSSPGQVVYVNSDDGTTYSYTLPNAIPQTIGALCGP